MWLHKVVSLKFLAFSSNDRWRESSSARKLLTKNRPSFCTLLMQFRAQHRAPWLIRCQTFSCEQSLPVSFDLTGNNCSCQERFKVFPSLDLPKSSLWGTRVWIRAIWSCYTIHLLQRQVHLRLAKVGITAFLAPFLPRQTMI